MAGDEGACEHVPGGAPGPERRGVLAELLQVQDRFSRLEGEREALQEQAECWGRKEAEVRELESFFLKMQGFLEAFTPGTISRHEGLAPLCTPPWEGA